MSRNLQRILQLKKALVEGAAPFVTLIKSMLSANQQARTEQWAQMIFDEDVVKTDPNLRGSLAASCHILSSTCHTREDFKDAAELFFIYRSIHSSLCSSRCCTIITNIQ